MKSETHCFGASSGWQCTAWKQAQADPSWRPSRRLSTRFEGLFTPEPRLHPLVIPKNIQLLRAGGTVATKHAHLVTNSTRAGDHLSASIAALILNIVVEARTYVLLNSDGSEVGPRSR
ncbi:hypothetical protein AB1N83_006576 [Pleurotus pulmonarius]